MSTTDFGEHEIKPNFYDASARKIFPKYGIQSTFLPDPHTQPLYKYLEKIGFGSELAFTLASTWWTIRNWGKFDIILGWRNIFFVAIARVLLMRHKPYICMILYRLYNPDSSKWLVLLQCLFLKFVSKGCDLLLSVDREQSDFFERKLSRPYGRTAAFKYGIDCNWFEQFLMDFDKIPKQTAIFCPGSAYRDDNTLFNAISDLELEVKRFQLGNEKGEPALRRILVKLML
jgi:hypothetical protein